ncbi:MAG: GWxTD domain-containing protein, partial [Bacteroidota bacterium]
VMDFDSLRYSTLALLPLLPQSDILSLNGMIKAENAEALRMYLFAFWSRENPINPEEGYRQFMLVADSVDKTFRSGFRNGFETDRGYVYIKYGQPNDISRIETDPTAPPYEIWSYDNIERTGQNNCRFIFYNPSLGAEDFQLLHSNVIGEISNPQWELELLRDAPGEQPADYFEGTQMPDKLGRQARRILTDY